MNGLAFLLLSVALITPHTLAAEESIPRVPKRKRPVVAPAPKPGKAEKPLWREIDERYAYDGDDLGCVFHDGKATLKLWAPLAANVNVILYDRDDQSKPKASYKMRRGDRGVWSCTVKTPPNVDLRGYYYQYEVTNSRGRQHLILDPYARSMAPVTISPSGDDAGASHDFVGKAAFVEPSACGQPPAPAAIPGYEKREDAIIYEVHIRDFTSDPVIGDSLSGRWGSFKAFIDRLPYIKSLGVTHVQFLPVMSWYFGDETRMDKREMNWSSKGNQYNWGYDPQSYFSLDGAYSEKPEEAGRRIAEFKALVDAVHKAGMGVILDVVYTHMAKASFLNDIVPDYYFFRGPDGRFLGDFGNNLATNRKMAAKLVVDSVKFWFSEYKIDGMRWDMMGDATADCVQAAFDAAKAINPKAIFIGEGWRTFKGHLEDPVLKGSAADQDWMDKTDSVGVFSDEFRNELKSGFGCEGQPMFLTGGKRPIANLFKAIKAQPSNTPADAPGDMVQYIEAHDNMTLHDVIAQSIKKDPSVPESDLEIHRRIRLGNAILLTSQGTAFLHAGQEWGRTKQWLGEGKPEHKFHELADASGKPFKYPFFIHDSYDSSDAVNRFDWSKVEDTAKFPVNVATREYTRGLIALRRSTDAFRHGSLAAVEANVKLVAAPEMGKEDLLIGYSCRATTGETYWVFINADDKPRRLTLPVDLSTGEVLVDRQTAGTKPISKPAGCTFSGKRLDLEPLTAVVIKTLR